MAEFQAQMKLISDESTRFMQEMGYEVKQINGQRHSVLIVKNNDNNLNKNPFPLATEVFVGKIPRDMFEKELFPHLSQAGKIVHLRIMMDFSGSTRGFGFAKYSTLEEAKIATLILNNTIVRLGEPPIGVLLSFDNKRLFFGKLPLHVDEECLLRELRKILDGVESVHFPETSTVQDTKFAFVEFKTHEAATQARRILVPGDVKMFNCTLQVDWAKPEKKSYPSNSLNSQVLSLPSSSSSTSLTVNNNNNNNNFIKYNYDSNNNNNNYPFTNNRTNRVQLASPAPSSTTSSNSSSSTTSKSIMKNNNQQNQLFTNNEPSSSSLLFGGDILGEKAKQMLRAVPNLPQLSAQQQPINNQQQQEQIPESINGIMAYFQNFLAYQQRKKQLQSVGNNNLAKQQFNSQAKIKGTNVDNDLFMMYSLLRSFLDRNNQ